jgi:hypothetical protein
MAAIAPARVGDDWAKAGVNRLDSATPKAPAVNARLLNSMVELSLPAFR